MNIQPLVLFFIFVAIFLSGFLVVLDGVSDQYLSSFSYAWSSYSNSTTITTSGVVQNFTLTRYSVLQNPTIYIAFSGGNESDQVYVNGNLIGNLSLPSPCNLTFEPTYLEYETEVTYDFVADANTNITQANISFYTYDGCNYDEETCRALDFTRETSGAVLFPSGFFLPLLAGLLLIYAIWGILK